ncbi:response regulator [Paenibacillus thalictri]|uniref:Response regulator n=1 Tax=Paenibacillus thalictri TaxID=2527873 RepID=A0A4Q9DVZ3_9BACL|nr:response regulator [Paenibacillus thalictri]TBL81199.1 response regulator [Paenibacillus thalictri]
MKVLLVDDKESVVQGIRKHIDWEALGVSEVEIALDGKEALEKFAHFPADLLVTDIKMPNMNGIELMGKLRATGHAMRFVVLSGYEEFEYAKQALALGASDYVLKPVDINELTEIVSKQLQELVKMKEQGEQRQRFMQTIRRSLPALRQQYLNEMIHFPDPRRLLSKDKWEFAEIPLHPQSFALLAIAIDHFQHIVHQKVEEIELSRFIVENIIGDCLPSWGIGIPFFSEWGVLTLLLNYDLAEPEKQVKEKLLAFAEVCRQSIETHSSLTVTIGISSLCPELGGLPGAYKEAREAIEHVYFFGGNQVAHFEDLLPYRLKRTVYPVLQEHELMTMLRRGQTDMVEEGVRSFFEALKDEEASAQDFRLTCIQLAAALHRVLLDSGLDESRPSLLSKSWYETCDTASLSELQDHIARWFAEAAAQIKITIQAGSKNIVGEAKLFIEQYLLQNVSLAAVADHVGVSPNYFSSLFKRETGSTFVEYVTDCKLKQAKEWLDDVGLPIYEIAERLGYHDRKYFREIFKRRVGVTPSEYREQRLGTAGGEDHQE